MNNNTLPSLTIDYTQHPGFAHVVEYSYSVIDIEELMKAIQAVDKDVHEMLADPTKKNYSYEQVMSYLQEHFTVMGKIVDMIMPDKEPFKQPALRAIERSLKELAREITFELQHKDYSRLSASARNIVHMIEHDGISPVRLSDEVIKALEQSVKSYKMILADRVAHPEHINSANFFPTPLNDSCYSLVRSVVKKEGILEAVSAMRATNMEIAHIALFYSRPQETWYKSCYTDVGEPDATEFATMHYDHGSEVVKMLVYLNEVTEENGPFTVLPASKKLPESITQMTIYKYLHEEIDKVKNMFDIKSNYWRWFLKDMQFRKHFMALPSPIRGTSQFGDDVLDDSPLADYLRENVLVVTSKIGNCFVFSGDRNIHRGGVVKKGERWALQVLFTPKSKKDHYVDRVKKNIKKLLRK